MPADEHISAKMTAMPHPHHATNPVVTLWQMQGAFGDELHDVDPDDSFAGIVSIVISNPMDRPDRWCLKPATVYHK